jgi:hypothetical protein
MSAKKSARRGDACASESVRVAARHLPRLRTPDDIVDSSPQHACLVLAAARGMGVEERAWPEFNACVSAKPPRARAAFDMLCEAQVSVLCEETDGWVDARAVEQAVFHAVLGEMSVAAQR